MTLTPRCQVALAIYCRFPEWLPTGREAEGIQKAHPPSEAFRLGDQFIEGAMRAGEWPHKHPPSGAPSRARGTAGTRKGSNKGSACPPADTTSQARSTP